VENIHFELAMNFGHRMNCVEHPIKKFKIQFQDVPIFLTDLTGYPESDGLPTRSPLLIFRVGVVDRIRRGL
jgi:hypothetical protein